MKHRGLTFKCPDKTFLFPGYQVQNYLKIQKLIREGIISPRITYLCSVWVDHATNDYVFPWLKGELDKSDILIQAVKDNTLIPEKLSGIAMAIGQNLNTLNTQMKKKKNHLAKGCWKMSQDAVSLLFILWIAIVAWRTRKSICSWLRNYYERLKAQIHLQKQIL